MAKIRFSQDFWLESPVDIGQRIWTAFCKSFSGITHLTILGAPKYLVSSEIAKVGPQKTARNLPGSGGKQVVCCETLERSPAQPSVYTWGALLSIQSACFSCLISNSHLWKNDINWKGARGFCNIWCMEYLCSLQSLALSCKWRWRWQKTTNENFPNMQQFVHFFLNLHSIEQAFQFVLLHCFHFCKKAKWSEFKSENWFSLFQMI